LLACASTPFADAGGVQLIRDIHAHARARRNGRPIVSFEFFPPKTTEGEHALLNKTLPELVKLKPDFCSVTYGAGGSTRDKTLEISARIQRQHGLTTMSHITCVGSTREHIHDYVERARRLGITNLLALRGDPPAGTGEFRTTDGGFEFSWQLVRFIREAGGFSIGTAGFPEGHIACKEGKHVDWQRLKAKVDCGADFVITQLFFDNRDFFEFESYLRQIGLEVPVCPGILPILSAAQVRRFCLLCGATLPREILDTLERYGDDDASVTSFGIDYAAKQCAELIQHEVPGLHFYTLNKAASVSRIFEELNLA
jgi:methylenetetrahydrofolate reductase (NADPH)